MASRKPYLLRLDPRLHAALERWAADELRSLNAQIEFLLRRSAAEAGRLPRGEGRGGDADAAARSERGSGDDES